jgi:hypothetical protein
VKVSARLGIASGGAPLVVPLEAANIWKLDDFPARGRLHGAMIWRVHLQGLMDSPPMVKIDVRTDNAAQVPLVKDNDVVQALSTERPDNPFGVGILPRTPRCGDDLFNIEAAHTPTELLAVDAIAIANQVFGRGIEGKGLDHLLRGPLRRRMCSDVEVDNAPTFMGEDDQDKQDLKLHGRHDEEVDRDEFLYMIVEKRLPGRRWRAVCTNPVFLHGRLRHGDAELCQLADDTR